MTTPTINEANLPIVCKASLSFATETNGNGSMYSDDPMKNIIKVSNPSAIESLDAADVAAATTGGQAFRAEMKPRTGTYICGAYCRTKFFTPLPFAQYVGNFMKPIAIIIKPTSNVVVAMKLRVCQSVPCSIPTMSAMTIYAIRRPKRNLPKYAYAPFVVGVFFMITDTTNGPHDARHDAPTLNPIKSPSIIFFS